MRIAGGMRAEVKGANALPSVMRRTSCWAAYRQAARERRQLWLRHSAQPLVRGPKRKQSQLNNDSCSERGKDTTISFRSDLKLIVVSLPLSEQESLITEFSHVLPCFCSVQVIYSSQ